MIVDAGEIVVFGIGSVKTTAFFDVENCSISVYLGSSIRRSRSILVGWLPDLGFHVSDVDLQVPNLDVQVPNLDVQVPDLM